MSKPWITNGLRKSIKTKNKLFNEGYKGLYKFYRNKILFLTRLSKKLYFHSYFEDNINNPKKCGMALTDLLIRKRKIESQLVQLGVMTINYLKTQSITQIS